MDLTLTVVAVLGLLVVSEIWWRKRHPHGEFSRKFVHITIGSFVAFWPFFLSWQQIRWLSAAFLIAVLISKKYKIWHAIHSVQRPTWGELYFGLATGLMTFITTNKWVYMAALLQMSLADGLAAVLGVRFGRQQSYLVFGHRKSIVGTASFFTISILIFIFFRELSGIYLSAKTMIIMSLGGSVIENLAVKGLDNLLIPVTVGFILNQIV
jgi:phytol kinase